MIEEFNDGRYLRHSFWGFQNRMERLASPGPAMALDLGGPIQIFGYSAHRLDELSDEELRQLDELTKRLAEPIGD